MVAGVAQALARRLNVPDWVVRAGFVVTAFMGGLGVVLYLAGWALIRSEDETESMAERFFSQGGSLRSWVGIGLIIFALLLIVGQFAMFDDGFVWAAALLVIGFLLYSGAIPSPARAPSPGDGPGSGGGGPPEPSDTETAFSAEAAAASTPGAAPATLAPPARSAPVERSYLGRLTIGTAMVALGVLAILDLSPLAIEPRPRHYIGLLTVVIGGGLLVGSFWGRARPLILTSLILLPALFVSPLLELGAPDTWTVRFRPTSFAELRDTYRVDVGMIDLDLSRLPWDGERVAIRVVGDGAAIRVRVPDGVVIRGALDTNFGWISTPSNAVGGIQPPTLHLDEPGNTARWGTLRLMGNVDIGAIHVQTVSVPERSRP